MLTTLPTDSATAAVLYAACKTKTTMGSSPRKNSVKIMIPIVEKTKVAVPVYVDAVVLDEKEAFALWKNFHLPITYLYNICPRFEL